MQAKEVQISQFLSQQGTKFIIPVYQRNYDWKHKQCQQLLRDIQDVNSGQPYFIGSIVHKSVSNLTNIRELVIIDGQQRITTLILLLYVIAEIFETNKDDRYQQIWDFYIQNRYDNSEIKLKLKPIDSDFKVLVDLINNNRDAIKTGNRLLENYLFFKENILSYEEAKKIYNNFNNLTIVEIALDENDNPQKIFQSLNSTGLELSQADLIRNFLLMNLKYQDQERIFKKYWLPIEENCYQESSSESKLSFFFRDFLTLRFKKIPSYKNIFEEFKNRYISSSENLDQLDLILEEMKKYSSYYNQFINYSQNGYDEITRELKNINKIEISVSYPFLLGLFDDYNNKSISKDELVSVLQLIQSFVFRRFICGLPTNALNKIFMTLHDNAHKVKEKNIDLSFYDCVAVSLLRYSTYQRFPTNEDVIENLKTRDIYSAQSKNKLYLFEMLENNYHSFNEKVIDFDNDSNTTIEHIFPQNPNAEWKSKLSIEEYNQMMALMNTLGNLTLVINNTSLGNRSFIEKRDLNLEDSKGYKFSKLNLNEELAVLNEWNLEEMNKRADLLAKKFIKIWQYPKVNIANDQTISEEIDVFDVEDPTKLKPEYIVLNNDKLSVTSNRDVLKEVLKYVYNTEPEVLFKNEIKDRLSITRDEQELRNPVEIEDDLFCEGNLSARDLYIRIKFLIETVSDSIDLRIKFRDEKNE